MSSNYWSIQPRKSHPFSMPLSILCYLSIVCNLSNKVLNPLGPEIFRKTVFATVFARSFAISIELKIFLFVLSRSNESINILICNCWNYEYIFLICRQNIHSTQWDIWSIYRLLWNRGGCRIFRRGGANGFSLPGRC